MSAPSEDESKSAESPADVALTTGVTRTVVSGRGRVAAELLLEDLEVTVTALYSARTGDAAALLARCAIGVYCFFNLFTSYSTTRQLYHTHY